MKYATVPKDVLNIAVKEKPSYMPHDKGSSTKIFRNQTTASWTASTGNNSGWPARKKEENIVKIHDTADKNIK